MERSSVVKKGAWSPFEDELLRDCVNLYGEGKWHLVPQRAGLNRCRKSCRLRWLNYLKPNIKRGDFSEDETDLMIRMHKLLGNRWSLIAGRLPGRTSNDVKNYWNTYMRGKVLSHKKDNNVKKHEQEPNVKPHKVIKPVPRAISKPPLVSGLNVGVSEAAGANATSSAVCENWWETLLECEEDNAGNNNTCLFGGLDGGWDEIFTLIPRDFHAEGETWNDCLLRL